MQAEKKPEVWQRGPVDGVPALLQPVAHAILQAEEEIVEAVSNMPTEMLWSQPAGVASVGFHLKHITGVLDRLFTYADGQMLGQEQFEQLKMENITQDNITAEHLLQALSRQVNITLGRLRTTKEKTLKDARGIGRQQIPTTVGGLLFHAAEHTMRHTGQLLVTAKMVKYSFGKN